MKELKFDFNNMMSHSVGETHGVTETEIDAMRGAIATAHGNLQKILADDASRISTGLEWVRLPYQDKKFISGIQKWGDEIADSYDDVISLGIGGSYLGLKAAQDALCPAYYNDFASVRENRPRIYFEGNNLDPDTLSVLLKNLNPKRTFVIVISKSGETAETKAAFAIVEEWLKKGAGKAYGHQICAVTDPKSGALRMRVNVEQAKDVRSFRNLPVLKGVGGRFSELNIGLLHLAISGIEIGEVLKGAATMSEKCSLGDIFKNPAYMYATLQTILYRKKGKDVAVMMPFSERLKSTADWYVQLLAESLGKKYSKSGKIVNVGRTPVSSRGTNDLHSIQQNNIEGENNKTVTFIRVEKFENDIKIPEKGDIISGKYFSRLLGLAEEATEWALMKESRPSCTVIMPAISPFLWGGLVFFFEMATAFEGELLDVNAFDQPGVEGYKNYMYTKLGSPGMPKEIKAAIDGNPLKKLSRFII